MMILPSQYSIPKFLPLAAALIATAMGVHPLGYSQAAPQVTSQAAPHPAMRSGKKQAAHGSQEDDGDRIFQQNCARCHAAPEGFSPRISGTIVRHMRVRASLSAHDEEELLRFLNPK